MTGPGVARSRPPGARAACNSQLRVRSQTGVTGNSTRVARSVAPKRPATLHAWFVRRPRSGRQLYRRGSFAGSESRGSHVAGYRSGARRRRSGARLARVGVVQRVAIAAFPETAAARRGAAGWGRGSSVRPEWYSPMWPRRRSSRAGRVLAGQQQEPTDGRLAAATGRADTGAREFRLRARERTASERWSGRGDPKNRWVVDPRNRAVDTGRGSSLGR